MIKLCYYYFSVIVINCIHLFLVEIRNTFASEKLTKTCANAIASSSNLRTYWMKSTDLEKVRLQSLFSVFHLCPITRRVAG